MKKIFLIFGMFLSISVFTQSQTDAKTLEYFENCIINRIAPTNSTGYTYGSNSRVINWRVSSIKDYEYSNEAFDKRGYELRKCSTKERRYYKHCGKGILVRVVDQKNYGLLIRMEWIPESLRERNVYLRPE